jgi:hypothetical protein
MTVPVGQGLDPTAMRNCRDLSKGGMIRPLIQKVKMKLQGSKPRGLSRDNGEAACSSPTKRAWCVEKK